jgi:hypothetical protein
MEHFFLYIDPGSSSYFVQAIIAAVVGGLFYFKQAWVKIKLFFGGKKAVQDTNNAEKHDGQ